MQQLKRTGWRRTCAAILLAGFFLLNGIAWMQARAMTHFAGGGQRTGKPESLSLPEKAWAILAGVTVPRPENTHTPRDVGLAYEARKVSLEGGGSLEGWFVPWPQAKVVVLMFPGYAESKDSLLAAAASLHEMGYASFMVDFRGVGGSSGDDTTLGVREAKDVARSVEYARQQWPEYKLALYGVSMGSAAVMRAVATEGVRPDAVILESPFDRLLSTVGNRFHALGIPATPGSELVVFWGSVQQGFNGFTHNPVEYAASIHCPALVLYGDHDPRVTYAEATSVFEHLEGPKEFVSFPGAGHETLAVFAPQIWEERVGRFLGQMQSLR